MDLKLHGPSVFCFLFFSSLSRDFEKGGGAQIIETVGINKRQRMTTMAGLRERSKKKREKERKTREKEERKLKGCEDFISKIPNSEAELSSIYI